MPPIGSVMDASASETGERALSGKHHAPALRYFAQGWSTGFDGPGRRWVLYLQGCNLRCGWCANPESFLTSQTDHFSAMQHGITVDDLCREAEWRRPLFTSGGGITFGGGEPTLQPEALLAATHALRQRGIHTTIESNAATTSFTSIVGAPDLLICDVKTISPHVSAIHTGADPERVRSNLRHAVSRQEQLLLRIPCIQGVNLANPERTLLVDFLHGLQQVRGFDQPLAVHLLRQHHLGEPKYVRLGRQYPFQGAPLPSSLQLESFAAELRAAGLSPAVFC